MMKKFLPAALLAICVGNAASAQDADALKKHYLKVYSNAIEYNDVNAAINGLYGYLAITDELKYKDTLSMLYFSTKSYYSSLILAEEVYKADANNALAMARAAECYDELGDPKTAVTLFEQVLPKTRSPYHAYKLATSQYQLKRMAESELSARAVIADTASKRIGVNFSMANGQQQAIPVNAAAANLLGVIKMDAKNFAAAKTDFQQALTLFPEFAGAKQNLDICDKALKGNATPAKQPAKPVGKTN